MTEQTLDLKFTDSHYRILMIATLMAMIAFFDFMAFWYSTSTISSLFLARNFDVSQNTFYMVLIFGLGYIVRPVGAILFGMYGDKYGRKPTLLLSFAGLTFFTFFIALLPTYGEIGIWATVLLVIARIGQGITFGSQLPTLWTYATEHLPINSIGMACGIITGGAMLSSLLLIILLTSLDTSLTQRQLFEFGWRVPFIIGGVLGLPAIYLCHQLKESPVFLKNTQTEKPALKERWQGFLPVLVLSWFVSSVVMILVFFSAELINLTFFVNDDLLSIAFVLFLLFLVIGCVFFGFLTDRMNAGNVLIIGCISLLLSVVGLFYDLSNNGTLILFSFALTGFFAGVIGAVPVIMVRLCPVRYRLGTLSLSYNSAYALSGAFIPIILGFLTYYADFAPAVYLSFVCIITMFLGIYIHYSPRSKEEIEN